MAALSSFKRIPGPHQLHLLLWMILLLQHLVVTGQNIEVTQLPESISVKAGETITLTCTLVGVNLPGGVRWYKGPDRNKSPIYSDLQEAANRGIRVVPGSSNDFSIKIQGVHPDDAGTYYCVKFRAGNPERELASGKGTLVSVIAKPSQPVVIGPTGRITAGSRASFRCSTGGFSPPEITVSWWKDGEKIPAAPANILNSDERQSISYRAESTVEIPLAQGDVKSQLTCQIQHSSLDVPLQLTFRLRNVLRVPPKVHLKTFPPSPVQMKTSVMVTCNAESFYPENAAVELLTRDAPSRRGMVVPRISNPDGTFSLKSFMEVMVTEDGNSSVFLCQVQQDSQPLVSESTRLFISRPLKNSESPQKDSILVLCMALILTKVAILLSISCLFLMKVCGRKGTPDHSGTFQAVRQTEKSA